MPTEQNMKPSVVGWSPRDSICGIAAKCTLKRSEAPQISEPPAFISINTATSLHHHSPAISNGLHIKSKAKLTKICTKSYYALSP
jgi:hypothetical protein